MGRRRRRKRGGIEGVVVIDKPVGPTSRAVVDDVSQRLGLASAGHCGTLDPLASGLLVLVAGSATRVQDLLVRGRKIYSVTIRLGARSATDDAEGPIEPVAVARPPTETEVREALTGFLGHIQQVPPQYSAVHVHGRRLHERARKGESVDVPPRSVRVDGLELREYAWPLLRMRMTCGPGTYVRSLARDLGNRLGTGGFVETLRREASGSLHVGLAKTPDELSPTDVLPLEVVLRDEPALRVEKELLSPLMQGREVQVPDATLEVEGILWCEEKVVARVVPTGNGAYRMKRLITPPC